MKILKKIFRILPISEKKKNALREKYKIRKQLTKEKLLKKIMKYDVVSFDIFDTLITRKIYNPDDIFKLIGIIYFGKDNNFLEMRKESEKFANLKLKKDVNIDEIYATMSEKYRLSINKIKEIEDLEKKIEISLAVPRIDMLEVFNKLKQNHKKIILVSDMYLDNKTICEMLKKCGYTGYTEFYLSNDLNMRKDTGKMWDFIKEKYHNIIHIGDNNQSDNIIPLTKGISCIKIRNPREILETSKLGLSFDINNLTVDESLLLGLLVNKKICNSPFCMDNIYDMNVFCYSYIAPIMLEFMDFIDDNSTKGDKLLFLAREGFELKKIYKLYCNIFNKEKKENEYFLTSRRATSLLNINSKEDIVNLCNKDFNGTVKELLKQIFNIDYNGMDFSIILPTDLNKIKDILFDNSKEILKNVRYEKESYQKYIDTVIKNDHSFKVIDLGYSGTIQYNLSKFLNKKIVGIYCINSDTLKQNKGDHLLYCFDNNINKRYLDLYHYSLIFEYFLSAPYGQLLYFELKSGKIQPVYNEEVLMSTTKNNIDICYSAMKEYFSDINDLKKIYNFNISRSTIADNYIRCIDNYVLSRKLKDEFVFSDYFNDTKTYSIFEKISKY